MTPYFQNERCTIYHGDCAEVLPQLGRFDLLLTDPPYGIGASSMNMGGYRSSRIANTEWDSEAPSGESLARLMACASECIVWGGNYFNLPPSRGVLVWDKTSEMEGRGFSECEVAWWSENKSSRIYRYSPTRMKKQHKTQKPLGLMQWCIGLANAPETIVDPFMGSGTTLHAAQLEGRHCVGIEREESYCEIAADRLAQKVLF